MSVVIPQVQFLDRLLRLLMKPVAIPRVQFFYKVICPSLLRLVPLVRQRRKLEIPQLKFLDKVVQISCRGAETVSHGPDCCRTEGIPLLLDKVIDVPVVHVVQLPGCGPQVCLVSCLFGVVDNEDDAYLLVMQFTLRLIR